MQTMDARAAYELWADNYPPLAHNPLMHAEERIVMRHLNTIRSRRALDVGTGSGRYTRLLATTGAKMIVGVDLSLGMLRRNDNPRRLCANALQLPLASHAFDLVNASLIAGDITDLGQWIAELSRVLAPGGHLVYSDFHPAWKAMGWQRTFRSSDGAECALPRADHQIRDHIAAIERAGLTTIAADDVRVSTGRGGMLRLWQPNRLRAAVVFHAQKAVQ